MFYTTYQEFILSELSKLRIWLPYYGRQYKVFKCFDSHCHAKLRILELQNPVLIKVDIKGNHIVNQDLVL